MGFFASGWWDWGSRGGQGLVGFGVCLFSLGVRFVFFVHLFWGLVFFLVCFLFFRNSHAAWSTVCSSGNSVLLW